LIVATKVGLLVDVHTAPITWMQNRAKMVRDDDARPGGRDEAAAGGRRGRSPSRQVVLLVEDSEADRDVYGGLLWYNGYDVVYAPDATVALELVARTRGSGTPFHSRLW
jgi:hypothetical protein